MGQTGRHDQAAGLESALSSPVIKRSVTIAGHPTSVSVEQPFWDALAAAAKKQGVTMNALISMIDEKRSVNLSSAIRLYVLHTLSR